MPARDSPLSDKVYGEFRGIVVSVIDATRNNIIYIVSIKN